MHFAVITTSYPVDEQDPSGHFVKSEVFTLLAQGHQVTLLVPRSRVRGLSGPPSPAGLRILSLPHWGLFGWPGALANLRRRPHRFLGLVPFAREARRALRDGGPFDALIAHWIIPGFWPISRDYEGNVSVVAHGSDVRLLERLPGPLQRRVFLRLRRPEVKVRCVSESLRQALQGLANRRGLPLGGVEVSPCAIAVPPRGDRQSLRLRLGVGTEPLVVVVGRVVKSKQIDVAIEAALRATGKAPTVIGDGPERSVLERHYPRARWLGQRPRNETLDWISAADCLLSASEHEGAPTAIREARALGVPVVSADAGDLSAWAEADRGLYVVSVPLEVPRRREQLAAALGLQLSLALRQDNTVI